MNTFFLLSLSFIISINLHAMEIINDYDLFKVSDYQAQDFLQKHVNTYDKKGFTPLIAIIINLQYTIEKKIDLIKLLLEHGADVNKANRLGFHVPLSAIFYPLEAKSSLDKDTKERNAMTIAQILLENGADVETPNLKENHHTVYAKAIKHYPNLAELFKERGADTTKRLIGDHNIYTNF